MVFKPEYWQTPGVICPTPGNYITVQQGDARYVLTTGQVSALNVTYSLNGSALRNAQQRFADGPYFEDYGAVGNGTTDDSAAIQTAYNSGKPVRGRPGTMYAIGTMLTVGNGTSSALSTLNGILIEGTTSGAALSEFSPAAQPTCFKWIGSAGGTMMTINGPIVGCNLSGLFFDCNNLAATAIVTNHLVASTWRDVIATRYTGTAFIHNAYAAFSGLAQGANKNTFINCRAKNPGTGGSGMQVGVTSGFVSGMLDVAQNTWINCEWYRDGATAGTHSLYLAFCDNLTFIECAVWQQGGTSGDGVYIKPPSGSSGNTTFPSQVLFLNCPNMSGFNPDASWAPADGLVCFPSPTSDGEAVPSSPYITWMDFTGRWVGGFARALPASSTPVNNGDLTMQLTSNTSLTFKVKGSDGTVRSGSIALA